MCVKWMFVSVCRRGAGLLCVCRWPVQRSWAGYSPPLSVQPLSLPFSWEACRGSGWTVPLFRKLRPREWIHPTNCPLDVQRSYLQQRIINKLYVLAGGRYSNAEFTLKDCCCNFSHTLFFWDHPQNLRSEANLHFFLWVTTTTCDRLKEAIWELAGAKEDIKQAKCVVVLGSHATGPQPIWDDRKRHILSPKFFPFSPLASFPVSLLACSVITTPSLKTSHWSDRSCCVQSTSTSRFLTPRTESCAVWTVQWSDIDM